MKVVAEEMPDRAMSLQSEMAISIDASTIDFYNSVVNMTYDLISPQ